jgi:hypothetical protein
MGDMDSSRNLRKSSRIQDNGTAPTSSPVASAKEDELPSPKSTSPRATRKRLSTHFNVEVTRRDSIEGDGSIDLRTPLSASSTGSGELSGHVCLCQPEPKIPRPRNGKYDFLVIPDVRISGPSPSLVNKESRLCLQSYTSATDFFVAFILYRQHHQHAIVAGNPGLANPEISKIIGEQWQAESEHQKKIWQDLAQVCSWHVLSQDGLLTKCLGRES